ncbi:MAG TPA: Crp/Fnr family transcriptional regulator [Bacillales bacterium]|nr:Crp/Fnr family transcriptional regulator [Bacillales bacterium]
MVEMQMLAKEDHPFRNSVYFSKKNLRLLQTHMILKSFPKGAFMFREGQSANHFYYLIQGAVKVTKSGGNGKELLIYCFRSGDFFGEKSVGKVKTMSFDAKCVQPSVIGIMDQKNIQRLMKDEPQLAIQFMNWMGYMQRFTQIKLRDLLFYGKMGALASTIIRMVNTFGIEDGDRIRLSVHFTNSELASMIGATRETVNRMLHQLKKDGLIDYQASEIIVYDIEGLKDICQCEKCPIEVCRL